MSLIFLRTTVQEPLIYRFMNEQSAYILEKYQKSNIHIPDFFTDKDPLPKTDRIRILNLWNVPNPDPVHVVIQNFNPQIIRFSSDPNGSDREKKNAKG